MRPPSKDGYIPDPPELVELRICELAKALSLPVEATDLGLNEMPHRRPGASWAVGQHGIQLLDVPLRNGRCSRVPPLAPWEWCLLGKICAVGDLSYDVVSSLEDVGERLPLFAALQTLEHNGYVSTKVEADPEVVKLLRVWPTQAGRRAVAGVLHEKLVERPDPEPVEADERLGERYLLLAKGSSEYHPVGVYQTLLDLFTEISRRELQPVVKRADEQFYYRR